MSEPGLYRLKIYCGQPFTTPFQYLIAGVVVDLTGWSLRAQARAAASPSATLLFTLSSADGTLVYDPAYVVGGLAGAIRPNLTAAQTAALWATGLKTAAQENGRALYTLGDWDLEITSPGGIPRRLLQGPVLISPEVTTS